MSKTKWQELKFRTPIDLFFYDWKHYGLSTAWYNQRYSFAYWLLGAKKMSVTPKKK